VTVRSEIENALYLYAHGYDSHDIDLLADSFTEHATLVAHDGTFEGREVIRTRFEGSRGRLAESARPRHVITNVLLENESPTQARSRAYFIFTLATEGSVSLLATGCYVDTWIRDAERWRIEKRIVESDTGP
jgi:3-phenylpropionate/cinnamic acid dioxygenase small subunit